MLKEQTGAPNAIGEKVHDIATRWRDLYHLPDLDPTPHFNRFWVDGDTFRLGDLEVRVMLSPGHKLASITYVVGDAAFPVHPRACGEQGGTSLPPCS